MQPSATRGILYVLFSICIWSGWFIASRLSVQGTLGAGDVTELRFFVSGVILLPVVIRRGFALETSGLLGGLLLTLLMGAPYSYLMLTLVACHATATSLREWEAYATPIYLFFEPHHIDWANAREVLFQSVYQGLLTAVLALIAFNRGVTILGVSRATAILPLVPLIATLLALVFLHEFPSLGEGIGIAAVSVGVLFASGIILE